jgi:hypothetical protein
MLSMLFPFSQSKPMRSVCIPLSCSDLGPSAIENNYPSPLEKSFSKPLFSPSSGLLFPIGYRSTPVRAP